MIWTGTPKSKGLARFLETRQLLTLILAGALFWSLASVPWFGGIVHTGGGDAIKDFGLALFPPELSSGFLRLAFAATWQTVVHAVAGITLAVVIGLPLGVAAPELRGIPEGPAWPSPWRFGRHWRSCAPSMSWSGRSCLW